MGKRAIIEADRPRVDFTIKGRMLSGSKSAYYLQHPDHVTVFNANVCVRSRGKIWHGDLDITDDIADLKRLALSCGETVYVLREMDARFQSEAAPLYDRAVATVGPSGDVMINDRRD
jgi:hypothetical protein